MGVQASPSLRDEDLGTITQQQAWDSSTREESHGPQDLRAVKLNQEIHHRDGPHEQYRSQITLESQTMHPYAVQQNLWHRL